MVPCDLVGAFWVSAEFWVFRGCQLQVWCRLMVACGHLTSVRRLRIRPPSGHSQNVAGDEESDARGEGRSGCGHSPRGQSGLAGLAPWTDAED